ncbi:MAG TPA: EAL domain-containing protein [Mycobacteriales bacterium]|nr:EAL domain-containing protein [Mycobacteriales bacterium]
MTISADLADAMGQITDPSRLLQRVTERTLELIRAADGVLVGFTDESGITYVSAAGKQASYIGTKVDYATSLAGLAVRTGHLQRSDDSETDHRVDRETGRRLSVVSIMCMPLMRGEQAIGVLTINSERAHAFSDADVATVNQVADFVAVVVSSARDLSRIKSHLMQPGDTPDAPPDAADTAVVGQDAATRYVMSVLSPDTVENIDSARRVRGILRDPTALTVVYQPIFDLVANGMTAVEALTRFEAAPHQPPNVWFEEAHRAGLGVDLELLAVERALSQLDKLPSKVDVTLNVGPATVMSERFREAIADHIKRVIIELTEYKSVDDYPKLLSTLQAIRHEGARLAVDDTGAGYASMTDILKLAPNYIKFDRALITSIDIDPVRRALATALVAFADGTGASIVAEGVEDGGELSVLRSLGVRYAQGYFLGRPSAAEEFLTDEEIEAQGA